MAEPALAVTGATGRLGGRVARRLARDGTPQRLVVRDPSRVPSHRSPGDVPRGDLEESYASRAGYGAAD